MKIWVDADAVPGVIKEIILRAAERTRVPAIFVANKNVNVGSGSFSSFVFVSQGADVADQHIVDASEGGDICVTADVPLAAALVEKGVTVIDPRGERYCADNIGERLAVRDLMSDLRDAGMTTSGPPPFSAKAKQKFASLFDSLLTKAVRGR